MAEGKPSAIFLLLVCVSKRFQLGSTVSTCLTLTINNNKLVITN
jgi:hypothetical protein